MARILQQQADGDVGREGGQAALGCLTCSESWVFYAET